MSRAGAGYMLVVFSLLAGWSQSVGGQLAVIEIAPVLSPAPPPQAVAVNAGPGHQYEPSVGPDLVAYGDGFVPATMRYFRFSTGGSTTIPLQDSFADLGAAVAGEHIAFSRVTLDRNAIMLHDAAAGTTVEILAEAGSGRFMPAVGGSTLAFIDLAAHPPGGLVGYDLTAGISQVLSPREGVDQKPNVSSDGRVIVWENCRITLLNCDVMAAIWDPGILGSAVETVDQTSLPENNPDTDGTWIVYDGGDRGGAPGEDIHFRAVSGGPTHRLAMPGRQLDPSISGGVIAFVSVEPDTSLSDVFAYVIATNTLYRITDTADLDESLPDVAASDDGFRLAWMTNRYSDNGDVYATTLLPGTNRYRVHLLYDPARAGKPKQPFLIRLQVLDLTGANVSDLMLGVRAVSVSDSTGAPATLANQGNSNPGFWFSYKPELNGYSYTLSTTALAAGNYVMKIQVGSETSLLSVPFAIR